MRASADPEKLRTRDITARGRGRARSGDHALASELRALGLEELAEVARGTIDPGRFVWVVVGDREKVEGPIRELGLGTIRLIDADGQVIGEAAAAR